MNQHKIYVVLTKSPTILSRLICLFSGDRYTHASLAFDRELDYMFSFGRRWARNPFVGCLLHERIESGLFGNVATMPCVILELTITREQYLEARRITRKMLRRHRTYRYNYFGLLFNAINRGYETKNSFFCSEFVYHILYEAAICDLKMPRSRIHPQDFFLCDCRIVYEGDLKKMRNAMLHTA